MADELQHTEAVVNAETPNTNGKKRRVKAKKDIKRDEKGHIIAGSGPLNPKGRPEGSLSITAAIKAKLEEEYVNILDPEDKKTYLTKIIDAIFHNAIELKDARTLKDIWAYIDGLPRGSLGIDVDKQNLAQLTEFFRTVAGMQHGEDKED